MIEMPNFGNTALDYKKYRQGFPTRFFQELRKRGIGSPQQKVLDIGTGTGSVARGFALEGCNVRAIDPSEKLIEQAKLVDKEADVSITYIVACAEKTNQPDCFFDIVVAGQAWHWFDAKRTIAEIERVLKPSGHLIIAHYDWIPLPGNVASLSEALILKYNPNWKMSGGNGFYPQWVTQISQENFHDIETFSFDVMTAYSHEAWRGRIRASAGVAASLPPEKVEEFDVEHSRELKNHFPNDPLKILHRCFAIIARLPTILKSEKLSDRELFDEQVNSGSGFSKTTKL